MTRRVVLVCGGRDYDDEGTLFEVLDAAHAADPISLLVHGGGRGADSLAGLWAGKRGVELRVFMANWKEEGKKAGPIRNQRMIDEAMPDLVIAFPGGKGTNGMVRRAHAAGVAVIRIHPEWINE